MAEVLDRLPLLADALALSTAWLAAGLLGARLLRRRPARAHAWVLACLVVAALAPLGGALFRELGWGLGTPRALPPPALAAGPLADAGSRPAELGPWVRALPLAWGALSALGLARLALGLRAARRWLREARPASPALARRARRVARRLGAPEPELRTVRALASPVVWCWSRRPTVLVPESWAEGGGAPLDALLAHELGHALRRDHVSALVADLARCVLPWHPGAALCDRALRAAAEEACDDWALAQGADPLDYADALLALTPCEERHALAARGRSSTRARVLRLLETPRTLRPRAGTAALGTAVAVTLVGALAPALAQPRPPAPLDPSAPVASGPLLAVPAGSGPLLFAPAELDLGETTPDRPATGRFALVHVGEAPVRVREVEAGCGCTTLAPTVEDRWLAPGERLDFTVAMEPSPTPGEVRTRSVHVVLDGHAPIAMTLRVRTVARASTGSG